MERASAYRWVLEGRVQGVGFRYFTRRAATALGICGWVRNRADGRVEVEASGPEEALSRFRRTLEDGPPGARVDGVREERLPEAPAGGDFEIRF